MNFSKEENQTFLIKVFGCKCILSKNGKDNLGKFDSEADEGIFLGYSSYSHIYRAYNNRTMLIEESVYITFDETNQKLQEEPKFTVEDKETEDIQSLNGIATKQDKEQTTKVKSRNSEIDSTSCQIDLAQE